MNFKLLSIIAISAITTSSVNASTKPFSQPSCTAEHTGTLPQAYTLVPLKCFIRTKPGNCKASITSWNFYLNNGVGTCVQGKFGGCADGCIAFPSKEECENSCRSVAFFAPFPKPAQFEQSGCKVKSPTPFKSRFKNMPATCFIATETGKCRMMNVSFHYDVLKNICVQSTFGGCDDGCQAFKTKESCESSCRITY